MMLTPLPWRQGKVASQAATRDRLPGGRAILAAGVGTIGSFPYSDFAAASVATKILGALLSSMAGRARTADPGVAAPDPLLCKPV